MSLFVYMLSLSVPASCLRKLIIYRVWNESQCAIRVVIERADYFALRHSSLIVHTRLAQSHCAFLSQKKKTFTNNVEARLIAVVLSQPETILFYRYYYVLPN